MIKIRQSYHGTGSKEGYRWKVYDDKGNKLGELDYLPPKIGVSDVVKINGEMYEVVKEYDSDKPREKRSEVIYYELEAFAFEPDYDLGSIT